MPDKRKSLSFGRGVNGGIFLTTMILVLTVLMGVGAGTGYCAEQYVLKALTAFETNNIAYKAMPMFLDMVEKESGGRLKINWMGGPEVIKPFDQPEALRSGMIDMILYIPTGYFKSILPCSDAKGLSQLTSPEERESGAFAVWEEAFREHVNAEILGFWTTHFKFQIFTKEEVKTIADLKGKILRVMPLYIPFCKEIGVSPITMPPPEIYTALQRGVIDGFIWLEMGVTPFGWHEIAKYMLYPTIFRGEAAMAVNLDKFKTLPEDLQQVLKKCMAKMEVEGDEILKGVLDEEHKLMAEKGVKTVTLSEEEGQKLVQLAQDITWPEVIKLSPDYASRLKELTTKK